MRIEKIKIDAILFASDRKYGGEGEIEILAADMKVNGLINSITLKELPKEVKDGGPKKGYEVVAGRRRIMAAILLGWKEISSCILEGDEVNHADEIAASENINRMAKHPLDEAKDFAKMLENGQTIEELAKRYDRKKSAIWQRIQLLDLNEDIKTLFRNGILSLHSAAMLKSLSDDAQKAFYKQYKGAKHEIDDFRITSFISHLGHDELYGFLRDKQCAECKTRTYFTDKNLFPEMDDADENCFNHKCYLEKWEKLLTDRIKSLKGAHKTHAEASLIVSKDDDFQKIIGKNTTVDGVKYNVLPHSWSNDATAKDKGAKPCFVIDISGAGKLEIALGYWKEKDKDASFSSYGSHMSPASKKKEFAPVIKMLDMQKTEADETLDNLGNNKRLVPDNFKNNVRDSVFWKIMEIKAEEFKDPKKTDAFCKELFLKKHLHYLHGNGKKAFELFAGKSAAADIAKMPSEKVFMLLAAMELNEYEFVDPVDFEKGKSCDILKWANLPKEKLKQLYQEEIRKRIPKKKPEVKKPAEKKQAKPKTPAAKKTTSVKKPARKKLPSAKHIKAVNAAKGKGKKK
jgi:ParB/RepB/Spo0J family partition protein